MIMMNRTYVPSTTSLFCIGKDTEQCIENLIPLLRITIFHYKENPLSNVLGDKIGYSMLKTPTKADALLVGDPYIKKYNLFVN